jgi:hypothetical protein
MDNELPSWTKSITEALYMEPTRLKPWTLAPDPKRPKRRTDNELPKSKKSMTDAADPHLPMPTTDTDEPIRA